jgi:RimJ/RimL family protein N-acetyltransferase
MENFNFPSVEKEKPEIKELGAFDENYFKELEGNDGWLALGDENYSNQTYFTVYGDNNEKLGIVGVFDTDEEKNVTHTVVDPKYRGQGLAAKFKDSLMAKLNLSFITLTISLDNIASIHATEKLAGVKKISDEQYEQEFDKVKYIYEPPKK